MKRNLGNTDKILRLIVAVVLAVLYLANIITGTMGLVLMGISLVFVITSIFGYCPLYGLLRINTYRMDHHQHIS